MKERHMDEDRYLNEIYGDYSKSEIEELLGVTWDKIVVMFTGLRFRYVIITLNLSYPERDNRALASAICTLLEQDDEE